MRSSFRQLRSVTIAGNSTTRLRWRYVGSLNLYRLEFLGLQTQTVETWVAPGANRRNGKRHLVSMKVDVWSASRAQIRPQPQENRLAQQAFLRCRGELHFAHQFRIDPNGLRFVIELLFDGLLHRVQFLQCHGNV